MQPPTRRRSDPPVTPPTPSHPMLPTRCAAAAAWSLSASLGLLIACSVSSQERFPRPAEPIATLDGDAYGTAARVQLAKASPEDRHGLHNVFHLSDRIISGSEPRGEEAFRELASLGVKTILSVDGKAPDAELASKYGMTYVHVPTQYKGMTEVEVLQITKTFREKPGPFYVHCFHGKHRGPAAAALGRVAIDGVSREQAIAEMRQWCGTAQSYEGLYRQIAVGKVPSEAETRAFAWDFPAVHAFDGFRGAMVEVSRADDNLKLLSKSDWKPSSDHPDLDALNEATKLASVMERASRLDSLRDEPEDFRRWLADSVARSAALRDALASFARGGAVKDVDRAYGALTATCTACHEVYRN